MIIVNNKGYRRFVHLRQHRKILFVRKTDEHIAVWEGEKLTKEKADGMKM